jgi:GNAT superfamily N-acetyltransferase
MDFRIADGRVSRLMICDEKALYMYWGRGRERFGIPKHWLQRLDWALVHQDYLDSVPVQHFGVREPYFRLIFDGEPHCMIPPGYVLQPADPNSQADQIASFINRCYVDKNLTAETVQGWTEHPVFDPRLWIWMVNRDGTPAALGIGELDVTIGEGALEWVQVLPSQRRRGLGQAVAGTLLQRLQGRALFITVAGRANDVTRAEALYRRCGFRGDDVWWLLHV